MLKKQAPNPAEKEAERRASGRMPEQGSAPIPKPKAVTFEELLREITEAKQAQKPVTVPETRPEPVFDYDDEIEEEENDLETIEPEYSQRENRSYEIYEEAKRQAFVRPSLEETMNVRNTNVEYGKFKSFEQEKPRNLLEEYTKDFQDPEGLKKAIVMSEILNRKF
ncbi:hypothetical protein KK060_20520 [Fulvivirgaceae bacterium PWU20]|uniref:Uncharacterized protein n=1 Tax=Chryseosolibacter indicus TaxID=2782351 RepID=A0ABS5VW72_9BACT|nr:hypothetical protein [Chryseosolibacter indicus]